MFFLNSILLFKRYWFLLGVEEYIITFLFYLKFSQLSILLLYLLQLVLASWIFCSFTSFLYLIILLIFTIRRIPIEVGSFNFTTFFNITFSTTYDSTYYSINCTLILSTIQIYYLTFFYALSCSFTTLCGLLKFSSIIWTSTYLLFHVLKVSTKHSSSLLFQFLYSKLFLITQVLLFLAYINRILTH